MTDSMYFCFDLAAKIRCWRVFSTNGLSSLLCELSSSTFHYSLFTIFDTSNNRHIGHIITKSTQRTIFTL